MRRESVRTDLNLLGLRPAQHSRRAGRSDTAIEEEMTALRSGRRALHPPAPVGFGYDTAPVTGSALQRLDGRRHVGGHRPDAGSACDARYVPPTEQIGALRVLQTRSQTKAFYDGIAGFYDLLAELPERPMRRKGLDMLAVAAGERILEIGFGTGHCLVSLAETVGSEGEVSGLDLSDGMVSHAQRRLRSKRLSWRVGLARGDAVQLPYRSGSMNAVFMSFCLELFDLREIHEVLTECGRVLRPDGRIAVISLSKEGTRAWALRILEWSHRYFPSLMDCRPIYPRRALEAARFSVERSSLEEAFVPVEVVLARKPMVPPS